MNDLTPFTLEPIIVPRTWGGRRLAAFDKTLPEEGFYGESWEVADLPGEYVSSAESSRSIVASGVHAGTTLRSLIESRGEDFLGSAIATPDGDFPLLVKLLDALEPLSVQVHPTAEYVVNHPGSWFKTESWYIVDADRDAVIYKGLKPGVTKSDVRKAVGSAALVPLLAEIPALVGAFHHLPAGTIHALGAGVVVAEVQTPSDTTFRLYDWADEHDRDPRVLHLDEGLETLVIDATDASAPPMTADGERLLIDTKHYWLREHKLTRGVVRLCPAPELRVLMVVRGRVSVSCPGITRFGLAIGATVVIPAAVAPQTVVEVTAGTTVLEIGLGGTGGYRPE